MADNFQASKVGSGETSSSIKFNNFVQAAEDAVNSLDNSNIGAAAAIAVSKLAAGASGSILRTEAGVPTWVEAFTTYVPAWTAATTPPVLGNGTITGRFFRVGKLVYYQLVLTAGTTTTFGTGAWRFSLPVAGSASFGATAQGIAADVSPANLYHINPRMDPTLALVIPYTNASPLVAVDLSNPITWATGDVLELNGLYEAA